MPARSIFLLCLITLACSGGEEDKKPPAAAAEDAPGGKANVVTTESGLQYEVMEPGAEGAQPKPGEKVKVHYTGWLTDGTKFDSSVDRGQPFEFTLGRGMVIKGWDEGVALMTEGAKYRFTIPPELAYGPGGRGKIPANATLVFQVELLKVMRPPPFRAPDASQQKKTESGLKYEVLKEGEGDPPAKELGVKLRFAVWSTKGDHIISTEMNGAEVSGTVAGLRLTRLGEKFLEEAVGLMRPGSRLLVEVPAELCWGAQQVPGLPPNSVTIWDLELIQVNEMPKFEAPDPANVKKTASGLGYEVLREGTGKSPKASDRVTVHYAGWLTDGQLFDSSYARGEPSSFRLNGVIAGWTEGLQLMKEGAQYRFTVPAEIAYGSRGSPPAIPADATLIFLIELVKVG